jgi:hypothetical protein
LVASGNILAVMFTTSCCAGPTAASGLNRTASTNNLKLNLRVPAASFCCCTLLLRACSESGTWVLLLCCVVVQKDLPQATSRCFSTTSCFAGPTAASGLNRTASTNNLKLNVMPRRFKVSLNHTCCWAHLPYMDRPLLLLSWVHELMLQRQTAGGLRMPAPILARVYTVRMQPFCLLWGVERPVLSLGITA